MTQETAWLDYTKAPHGFEVNGQWWRTVTTKQSRWWGTLGLDGVASAWSAVKEHHDPPGMEVEEVESVVPEIDGWGFTVGNQQWSADWRESEARAAAWAWHDRRRAIVIDIDEQLCSRGNSLAAWMTLAIAWTDAECAEVEAYAALPFPRSVDMPAPLQRMLLPEGQRTC